MRTKPPIGKASVMTFTSLVLLWLLASFLHTDAWQDCRAYPESCDWPSPAEWQALNESIGNRLLRPLPPAAPCHLSEPDYNNSSCAYITSQWSNSVFHADNPISTDNNNWNNDSCLPSPLAPCSGEGYPVYVVNATCVEDVQKGVDFAREHNVRLVVKGTGHDYLGRYPPPTEAITVSNANSSDLVAGRWLLTRCPSGLIICAVCPTMKAHSSLNFVLRSMIPLLSPCQLVMDSEMYIHSLHSTTPPSSVLL